MENWRCSTVAVQNSITMDGVRTFLESSTIHGLTYISSTKKWSRLFWVLVVLLGFIGAASLIHESFHSWTESPIKTTIETLPISQLNFPVVTVCPPKNTYRYKLRSSSSRKGRQKCTRKLCWIWLSSDWWSLVLG